MVIVTKQIKKYVVMLLVVCLCFANVSFTKAAAKVKIVTTQKQLEEALQDNSITNIKLVPEANSTITIPKSTNSDKVLLIQKAVNVTIHNYATFKKIQIKGSSIHFNEYGSNNIIKTYTDNTNVIIKEGANAAKVWNKAIDFSMTIEEGASLSEFLSNRKKSSTKLDVDGQLEKISVTSTQTTFALSGNTKTKPNVFLTGKEGDIKISLSADIKVKRGFPAIVLNRGAEDSVLSAIRGVNPSISNKMDKELEIKTPAGALTLKRGTVIDTLFDAIKEQYPDYEDEKITGGSSQGSSSSASGSSTVTVSGIKINVEGSPVLSGSAIKMVSGSSISLKAEVTMSDGTKNSEVTWSSSNEAIAEVKEGVVTAKKASEEAVTITATSTKDSSKTSSIGIFVY